MSDKSVSPCACEHPPSPPLPRCPFEIKSYLAAGKHQRLMNASRCSDLTKFILKYSPKRGHRSETLPGILVRLLPLPQKDIRQYPHNSFALLLGPLLISLPTARRERHILHTLQSPASLQLLTYSSQAPRRGGRFADRKQI